jgi:AraC family transcriptional regulator
VHAPLVLSPADHQLALSGFRATRTHRAAGLRIPRHSHDCTNIALCVSGAYDETVGGRWRRITPATLVVRPAGEPHANRYWSARSTGAVIFEALPATVDEIGAVTPILGQALHVDSAEVRTLARRALAEFMRADQATAIALEAIAYEAIAFAARRGARPDRDGAAPWLLRVVDLLHADFLRPLRMADLRRAAGVHPAHIARTFRARFGRSIGGYVRELRIAHAARLLAHSDRSLASIAAACFFYDQSHFTRVFVRCYGLSPGRYRSLMAAENLRPPTPLSAPSSGSASPRDPSGRRSRTSG